MAVRALRVAGDDAVEDVTRAGDFLHTRGVGVLERPGEVFEEIFGIVVSMRV